MNYSTPYVFPALNGNLPNIGDTFLRRVTEEVHRKVQAPIPMTILTAIHAASAGFQHRVKVELHHGKVVPIGTYGINVANSGERKTAVDNVLTKSLREKDKQERKLNSKRQERYELEVEAFKTKRRMVKKEITKSKNFDPGELVDELSKLEELKPEKPKLAKIVYEDTTVEALLMGMSSAHNSAYLGSSEGGTVFQSGIMSATPVLNAIYSGDSQTVDRKTAESIYLDDARLTIHVMTQPSTLNTLRSKQKVDMKGNGFLARCLVCVSQSLCGYRFSYHAVNGDEDNYVDEFNSKIAYSLSQCNSGQDTILRLSESARVAIAQISDNIERQQQPGGRYENDTDHASKLIENVHRVAAILHCLNSDVSGQIELEEVLQAVEIVSFFSDHYMSLFSESYLLAARAEQLYEWINNNYIFQGVRYLRCNWVMKRGPDCIRKGKPLYQALEFLEEQQRLKVFNHKRYSVIDLFPAYGYDDQQFNNDLSWQTNRPSNR
tara:strand:- start:1295 stop:2770 length:1476 start_codon:yes stop_codon:yes gene_type:complete